MQNRRGLLFLGLAILLGVVAALGAERWLSSQTPEAPGSVEMAQVVVARVDLPIAAQLNSRQLDTVAWPAAFVPGGAYRSLEQAEGRVLKRPLQAGEPVLETALLEQGAQGGLPAVISPNHRALSVKVDAVIGVAGFVKPGARVDVLATLRRVDQEKALPYTKAILQDVRVLAVDQKLERAREGEPELVNVVTLEVDPEQAEKLTYAAHEGNLQLALRNPADTETVETLAVGVVDLLGHRKRPAPQSRVARATVDVQVIKGSDVQVKSF